MTPDPQRARAIFLAAVEQHSPNEWPEFLASASGGDQELCHRVEVLLRAHQQANSLLDAPAAAPAHTIDEPFSERPGTIIGPYKLLERIGEGGFGFVYMADQQHPVRRRVALKLIKPGMDTRRVVARFEAERQALAIMDHPNIARVFDGGATATGRPFFVMELVKGVPITDFCDQNRLTPRQRLELFVSVCAAVQHAHQKGIIHRDLKPSNILVSRHDTTPMVKVIDFGVAKALGQELTDKTLFTGLAELIGTPLYMSPEQVGMSDLDIDTRSDIYALGVLLYQLLTGTTPFDQERLGSVGCEEIRRIIREEEPARPSTRMSTLGLAGTTMCANRQSDPRRLRQLFRGELDWIVMKALEKDRSRRYETASSFAMDVKHYLADEPVLACPPSAWYRVRKFARRNKAVLATASVVGLAVVVLATSLVRIASEQQARRIAQQAELRAEDERKTAVEGQQRESYFHRITLAHRDLAVELLAGCPKDLREWEWHYLMRLCHAEPLVIPDTAEIHGVAFSRDREQLASAGGDGIVKIWNSKTGQEIHGFQVHTDSVVSIAFHPDGKHLASRSRDLTVKVWDLTTDQAVFTEPCDVTRPFGTAYTIAFSPDGRLLAWRSDGVVKVWDWKNRQLLHSLPGHDFHTIAVAFSGDGRLATGTKDGVNLWDLETETPLPIRDVIGPISALAFSADGKWLASASYDKTVTLSDSTTGRVLHKLLHTGNQVECVAISLDGRRVASGGEDRRVRVWDATTGREILGLRGHTDRCECLAFSPDGHRLASASFDGTIRIWDGTPIPRDEPGQETLTFTEHSDELRSVAFSPVDDLRIASAGSDKVVRVWDAQTGRRSAEPFSGHEKIVFCVAWHPEGRLIASASNAVRVWDARTRQQAFELSDGLGKNDLPYNAVAFSPDGRYLVTGRTDGTVGVWDGRTGEPVGELDTHKREIRGLVFSPTGDHLASASGDGIVKLWDATRLHENQEARLTLRARVPGPSLNVAFSPDGRRLATGGEKNMATIWNVQTGERLRTIEGHTGEVYTLAFSPDDDGRWIASAGEDSTVRIWDSHSGILIRTFRGHTGLVSSVSFSRDGRYLASGSRDKTVKVWDMTQLQDATDR